MELHSFSTVSEPSNDMSDTEMPKHRKQDTHQSHHYARGSRYNGQIMQPNERSESFQHMVNSSCLTDGSHTKSSKYTKNR